MLCRLIGDWLDSKAFYQPVRNFRKTKTDPGVNLSKTKMTH